MLKHIPNILTIIRFILVPFVVIFSVSNHYILAIAIILLASLTDILDGGIARKYNITSTFGKLMDPLADKFMQLAILFALYTKSIVPLWIVLVFFIKELALIIGAIFLYKKDFVVSSNWYGKLATVLIYVALIFSMVIKQFNFDNLYNISQYIYYFAIALTVFSFAMYAKKNFIQNPLV